MLDFLVVYFFVSILALFFAIPPIAALLIFSLEDTSTSLGKKYKNYQLKEQANCGELTIISYDEVMTLHQANPYKYSLVNFAYFNRSFDFAVLCEDAEKIKLFLNKKTDDG